jgi:RNA polymerase sigma factor (sigma-70 family)
MNRSLANLFVQLRRAAAATLVPAADAELLTRFTRCQDNTAYELLFWRHGPMVWSVCKRLLGDSPDAEDAFQATFLVLASRAKSVGDGAAVAGWLHQVAWRTSMNARRARARRTAHEAGAALFSQRSAGKSPLETAEDKECKAVLDQEIARLPSKFRLPVILCDLEGRSRESAAELRCSLGTLHSRLARGRQQLIGRLQRRGLAAPLLATTPVPVDLAAAALRTLSREPSAAVATLAKAMLWSMALATTKKVAGAVAVCCLLAAGVAMGTKGASEPTVETPLVEIVAQDNLDEKLNFIDPEAGPLPKDAVARIGSTRFRHDAKVTGLQFSPDGKWLASISTEPRDATARIWDAATGKERFRVKVTASGPFGDNGAAMGFSSDGKEILLIEQARGPSLMAVVPDEMSIRSFDVATGKELNPRLLNNPNKRPNSMQQVSVPVAISPDGNKVVVIKWAKLQVHETRMGALIKTADLGPNARGSIKFSPDSRRFVITDATGLLVFDADSLEQVGDIKAKTQYVHGIAFCDGGQSLAVLVDRENQQKPGSQIQVIDVKSGKLIRTIDCESSVAFAFALDGKSVAVGGGGKSFSSLVDFATGKEIGRIPSKPTVEYLTFSPDGKQIAGYSFGRSAIAVWDVARRSLTPAAAGPLSFDGTTFSADGKALVLGQPGKAFVDWRTGKVLHRLADVETDREWSRTVLSPDQKLYAMGGVDGSIQLLNAETGMPIRTLIGHKKSVYGIKFSRDGRRLFTVGEADGMRCWDLASGAEIAQFSLPERTNYSRLSVSDDGRILMANYSGSEGKTGNRSVHTWNVDNKKQLAHIKGPYDAVLSPDGRFVAGLRESAVPQMKGLKQKGPKQFASVEAEVGIWEASSGRLLKLLPGLTLDSKGGHLWCGFSSNGQLLLTGDAFGKLRLWEVLTGQPMYEFEGHRTRIFSGSFSPDGRLLLTTSHEAPCFIWDIFGTEKPPQDAANLEQLWQDLADADAKKAFQAIRALVVRPGPAVEMLNKNLRLFPNTENAKIEKLIRDLDSPAFAVREAATAELIMIAATIEPALTKTVPTAPLELRARVERILEKAAPPTSDRLRENRAVGILEVIASPEAAKLLGDLATGSKHATLTAEASAAHERLRTPAPR